MKKKWIFIIAGALILILIIGKSAGIFGKSELQKISAEQVQLRSIIETVSANGKIQPEIEVKISPDVSGEIVELYVEEGEEVKKGQLLAKINPDFYLSNLDRFEAALNTSKANYANAKARLAQVEAQFINAKVSFERSEKLWKQSAISVSEFDAAKSQYEVAKAEVDAAKQNVIASEYNVKSAEASLKEAKDNLTKTNIFAPMAGTITRLSVEKGERVVGTSQFAGTEIMRISNLDNMQVKVNVSENDIVRVHLFDTVIIEIDAFLNRKFKGIVTQVANSANSSTTISADQVTNFEVKINILHDSYKDLMIIGKQNYSPFRPGMSATVDIQTKKAMNVMTVPIQSVTTRSDSTLLKDKKFKKPNENNEENEKKKDNEEIQEYVFLFNKEKGIVELTKVKTGIQDNSFIEILEGIKINDEIVSGPYRAISKRLKDKDKVQKVDKNELFKIKE